MAAVQQGPAADRMRVVAGALLVALLAAGARAGPLLFADDFESGAPGWIRSDPAFVEIVDSGDPAHGRVLQLSPAAGFLEAAVNRLRSLPPGDPVFALIEGSERWGAYRIEGEVFFPEAGDAYLGVIYHHTTRGARADFGSVYVIDKPDERYIRLNPHYDWNPARALFEEFRVPLEKPADRAWLRFAAEVVGPSLHYYVGDAPTPRVVAAPFDGTSGQVGLNPRSVGAPVWVDSIRVLAIDRHAYTGPPPVAVQRSPGSLGDWEALGPFAEPDEAVEQGRASGAWKAFAVDPRGALVSAKLAEFASGDRRFVYLRTRVAPVHDSILEFASAAPIALWIDGRRASPEGPGVGRLDFRRVAWFDFREGAQLSVVLRAGRHDLRVRVESDYSGAGFFARLRPMIQPGG